MRTGGRHDELQTRSPVQCIRSAVMPGPLAGDQRLEAATGHPDRWGLMYTRNGRGRPDRGGILDHLTVARLYGVLPHREGMSGGWVFRPPISAFYIPLKRRARSFFPLIYVSGEF
jgi:hypothetical protein